MNSTLTGAPLPLVHLIAAVALVAGGCDKADPRLSSPKSTAKAFYQAMYDNDAAGVQACIAPGPGQQQMADGMTKMTVAMRRATDAAFKRYGKEFEQLAGGAIDMAHVDPKQIDGGVETITGDTATVVLKDKSVTMRLIRVKEEWKVDLVGTFSMQGAVNDPQLERVMSAMFAAMVRAADQTTAEIEAGKHPGAKQAVQALLGSMKKAIEEEKQRMIKEVSKG